MTLAGRRSTLHRPSPDLSPSAVRPLAGRRRSPCLDLAARVALCFYPPGWFQHPASAADGVRAGGGAAPRGLLSHRVDRRQRTPSRRRADDDADGGGAPVATIRTRMGDGSDVELTPRRASPGARGRLCGRRQEGQGRTAHRATTSTTSSRCSPARAASGACSAATRRSCPRTARPTPSTRPGSPAGSACRSAASSASAPSRAPSPSTPSRSATPTTRSSRSSRSVTLEQHHVEAACNTTILPIFYGFMPNLGLYFQPDGPFPNPSDLLPRGQIEEARAATGRGDRHPRRGPQVDDRHDGRRRGRRDQLRHHRLDRRRRVPRHPAGRRVGVAEHRRWRRGRHGGRDGARLPRRARVRRRTSGRPVAAPADEARRAGRRRPSSARSSTPTRGKTSPWNIARSVTFVKACTKDATIPIHPNVGMGVGGVPSFEVPPADVVTRASAAMIEVGGADGL